MNKLSRNIVLTVALGAFALSPIFASADSDDKNKAEKNQEKIEKRIEKQAKKLEKKVEKLEKRVLRENGKCWNKFFPRMLPFSWVRANLDNINLNSECFFGTPRPKATSTPDTVAPVISDIISRTGQSRALVVWNTNEKTTSKIYYSTSSPVNIGISSVISINNNRFDGKGHYVILSGLVSSTTYYARIEAKDRANNTSTSSQFSLTTAP